MKWYAWVIGAATGIGFATWYASLDEARATQAAGNLPEMVSQGTSSPAPSVPSNWPPAFPEAAGEPERVPLPPIEAPLAAVESMAQARDNGDPRTPPIQRDAASSAKPTAAELADPAAYQRFEARQHAQVLSAFTRAAAAEAPRLREDIARAHDAGISPEEIAKAEEKLRRIEEMRARVLSEHPELAH